jgi:uncharacterized protein YecT (DUF1311 family)
MADVSSRDRKESHVKFVALASGVALVFVCHVACADDVDLTKEFSACMDQSGGVTSAMLSCMGAETKRQDARLNKAYKDVMAQLSPARKTSLQEVQRLWIKYRDANCHFYADPEGGTAASVNAASCVMTATAARSKELEGFKE